MTQNERNKEKNQLFKMEPLIIFDSNLSFPKIGTKKFDKVMSELKKLNSK